MRTHASPLPLVALATLLHLSCTPPASSPGPPGDDDAVGDDDTSYGDDDDAVGDDDTSSGDDDDGAPHDYRCTPVGTGHADGFFALRGFQGALYAGEFGYGREAESMVYRYPPWELTSPGLTGISESVCAMAEFDGRLYANTEDDGDIFRSADGSTWERVHDGDDQSIGCGLEVFDGRLYALNYRNQTHTHGAILRTADGTTWETVWDSGSDSLYVREIVAHEGVLYAYYVDEDTDDTFALTSVDGTTWTAHETPSRMFRAHSHDGVLWLGSTDRGGHGQPGVWRYDGSSYEMVHQADKHYVTQIAHWDGALFAGTSDGFKDDTGTSTLLMSRDGESWEAACAFSEIAIWSLAVVDDTLYLGTWEYEVGGQVHRVDIVSGGDDDDDDTAGAVDCALIAAANPAWEVCEVGPTTCAGVFTDGAGCDAFCAPAGLVCTARFGGEPGCVKEADTPIPCQEDNGHQSDWCECG